MCTESEVKRVFKLYSWHKCKFEKARKYAVSGKLDILYLHIFSTIFSFIFCDCPFTDFKGVVGFLQKIAKVYNLMAKIQFNRREKYKDGDSGNSLL